MARAGAALALAWLLPTVTYLLGIAAVVSVVVLVGTAGLLRGGRTLLDRLVLALAVLLGATCGGALLFAVWPFGMHPVAVGGLALTVLVLVAVLTGRRPTLPRPDLSDLLTLGAAVAVAAFAALPLLRRSRTDRLAVVLAGEDLSRHLSLYDGIRDLGGYAFQKWDAAHALMYGGMVTYPQGQHMLAGLLDGFVRSSGDDLGSGLSAMDHYLGSHVLGYGLFALVMVWAAQWVAAGVLTPLRRIVLTGVVTTMVVVGDLVGNLVLNYTTTVLGLAEMALLVAVLARGVAGTRQQLVTIACLVVAVGFTYYLFLPAALLAVLAWLVVHRRRVLRHRVATAVTVVVAAPVALVPVTLGLFLAGQAQALLRGGELRPSRDHLIALGATVTGAVLFTRCRRARIWRTYLAVLAAAGLLGAALLAYQAAAEGGNGYYANKALHLVLVVLLVGLGALLHLLPSPRRGPDPRRAWLQALAPGLAAALVVSGAFGLVRGDAPYRPTNGTTWPKIWWFAQRRNDVDARAIDRLLAMPAPPADVAVIVYDVDPFRAYFQTLFLGTFQRRSGRIAHGLYLGPPVDEPDRLGHQLRELPGPVEIVVASDDAEAHARQTVARYPDRRVEVVRLPS
ncbi:hypothetical protein GCM10009557_06790 [Virgisporangium ochraceum]